MMEAMTKTHNPCPRATRRLSAFILLLLNGLTILTGQNWEGSPLQQETARLKKENKLDSAILLLNDAQKSSSPLVAGSGEKWPELEKAGIYRMTGQYDTAELLFNQLIGQNPPIPDRFSAFQAKLYYEAGSFFLEKGALETGKKYIEMHLKWVKEHYGEKDTAMAPGLNKLGNYYYYIRDLQQAMQCYQNAYEFSIKSAKNLKDIPSYLQNMAIIYSEMGEYAKAEEYFLESLKLVDNLKVTESFQIGKLYINLGKFYATLSAFEKAHFNLNRAERIIEENFTKNHPLLGLMSLDLKWKFQITRFHYYQWI
jgi:tetratricopeptide (TPR) repeat protein